LKLISLIEKQNNRHDGTRTFNYRSTRITGNSGGDAGSLL